MKHSVLFFLVALMSFFTLFETRALTYNQYDVEKLQAFLIQESAVEGKKNWEQLGLNIEPLLDNISKWAPALELSPSWGAFYWQIVGEEYRLDYIYWTEKQLGGTLDLSGCTTLKTLNCGNLYQGSPTSNQLIQLDLSGCSALEDLSCTYLQLETLILSGCSALKVIHCEENKLEELNVSDCSALTDLYCFNNQLAQLDVSGLDKLKYLHCYKNLLEQLNVIGCSSLYYLVCNDNKMVELDASGCETLGTLTCFNNFLEELNVSGCKALSSLSCYNNKLQSLDLKDCVNLFYLYCNNNQLQSLDLSVCTKLNTLYCYTNLLEKLNVSGCTGLASLWCHENAIPFAELPIPNNYLYIYTSQNIIHPEVVDAGSQIDLSHMTMAGGETKIFYNDKEVGSVAPGKESFTVPSDWSGKITLKMTHSVYPSFDLTSPFQYSLEVNPLIVSYHTVALTTAGGIRCDYTAGELVIAEGSHLHLQFLPEDPALTAADVLLLVDGVETSFKDFGSGQYFSYILNPIEQDHSIEIALREYIISLPDIVGATLTPGPGAHSIAYGSSFTFTIDLKDFNDFNDLKVLADGIALTPDETGQAQSLQQYTIDRVTGPVTIAIEGLAPTGNIDFAKDEVSITTVNCQLSIANLTTQAVDVQVYDLRGQLIVSRRVIGSERIPLEAGAYIIRAGNIIRKIMVND